MDTQRFRSKVDWWIALILAVGIVMLVGSFGVSYERLPMNTENAIAFVVVAGATLLLIWIPLATYYDVDKTTLTIVAGPIRWRIPITDITEVEETRSPISAPALSLDRLRIRYTNGKCVMVSPRDKAAFLKSIGHSIRHRG